MKTVSPPENPATTTQWLLQVAMKSDPEGEPVAFEPVLEADLQDVRGELWLHSFLRNGFLDVPLDRMPTRIVPVFSKRPERRLRGYLLETTTPDGRTWSMTFSQHSLRPAADRAAERLQAAGRAQPAEGSWYFNLVADPGPDSSAAPTAAPAPEDACVITVTQAPLAWLSMPIGPLLKRARNSGEIDGETYPVFYTEQALAQAEQAARRGSSQDPPVETGAVLVGPLCSCPDTGEFFSVVCSVIEVRDAEETPFALSYSGQSWSRIQAVMRAMRAQPATRAHRILGQAHGHPFDPGINGQRCADCDKRAACSRTSVFVSSDDLAWSRAVFTQEPFQLAHIFGIDARGGQVNGLFGLRDGTLLQRGFHVIPSFELPPAP